MKNLLPASTVVKEITRLHTEILSAAKTTLDKAIRAGELLTQQKAELKHGDWLPWIEANLPFAERTARNYMRCYDRRAELKSASVADLNDAYRLLSPPKEQKPAPAATISDDDDDLRRRVAASVWPDLIAPILAAVPTASWQQVRQALVNCIDRDVKDAVAAIKDAKDKPTRTSLHRAADSINKLADRCDVLAAAVESNRA